MTKIHQCECDICKQSEYHPDQEDHQLMNLIMSRLNEQQRRWYAGMEAKRRGYGGSTLLAKVTGISVETIRRGRYELENGLTDRPIDRVRNSGGGRKSIEKKRLQSRPPSKK